MKPQLRAVTTGSVTSNGLVTSLAPGATGTITLNGSFAGKMPLNGRVGITSTGWDNATGFVLTGTNTVGTYPYQITNSISETMYGPNPTVVTGATVTVGGHAYTSVPTVTFTGGGGSVQATGTALVGVYAVTIQSGGTSYVSGDVGSVLTLTGGTGTEPTLTITTVNTGSGTVTGVSITTAGSLSAIGSNPVSIGSAAPSTTGSGATFNLTYTVVGITIATGGTGYTSEPTIGFSTSGSTVHATATPTGAATLATSALDYTTVSGIVVTSAQSTQGTIIIGNSDVASTPWVLLDHYGRGDIGVQCIVSSGSPTYQVEYTEDNLYLVSTNPGDNQPYTPMPYNVFVSNDTNVVGATTNQTSNFLVKPIGTRLTITSGTGTVNYTVLDSGPLSV